MEEIMESLENKRAEIVGKIAAYNAALEKNNFAAMNKAESDLKDLESEYAKLKNAEVFDKLKREENPIKAAIAMRSYFVVGHRVVREEGVITGFEINDNKVKDIDLVKFFESGGIPALWQYKVEKFNQLLALRAANELNLSKKEIEKISTSFYMNRLAKQIDMGGTPDSDTAICKQLQMILDEVLFEDNGKGKNIHRVLNRDVKYLLMCYTKRGKEALTVDLAKNSYVHRIVVDVFHRIVTGKVYGLNYQMVKKSDAEAETPKPAADAPKSEDKKPTAKKSAQKKAASKVEEVKAESEKTESEVETVIVEKTA